jgi:hypothetical protein
MALVSDFQQAMTEASDIHNTGRSSEFKDSLARVSESACAFQWLLSLVTSPEAPSSSATRSSAPTRGRVETRSRGEIRLVVQRRRSAGGYVENHDVLPSTTT